MLLLNPPNAIVPQAVRLGNDRAAARLRSEFRISDRRFWGIKVTPEARTLYLMSRKAAELLVYARPKAVGVSDSSGVRPAATAVSWCQGAMWCRCLSDTVVCHHASPSRSLGRWQRGSSEWCRRDCHVWCPSSGCCCARPQTPNSSLTYPGAGGAAAVGDAGLVPR